MDFVIFTDTEAQVAQAEDDALINYADQRRWDVERLEREAFSWMGQLRAADKINLSDELRENLTANLAQTEINHTEAVKAWRAAETNAKEARERRNVRNGFNPDGSMISTPPAPVATNPIVEDPEPTQLPA